MKVRKELSAKLADTEDFSDLEFEKSPVDDGEGNDFDESPDGCRESRQTMSHQLSRASEREKVFEPVYFEDFRLLAVLGQGTFGKVYAVQNSRTGEILAMKSIKKEFILVNKLENFLKNEKNVWQQIDHPFVLELYSFFNMPFRVYFLMPFY